MAGKSATKAGTPPTNGVDHVSTYCALCVSRCGAVATIEDGAFVALRPDPSHPTGHALCVKGKAAPELVGHADRLLQPLARTNPKGAEDPGWRPISWDEALDTVASQLLELARDHGPETVVFSATSPSTSAMSDAIDWVMRLRRAFGSPNQGVYMELCGWGRYLAPLYTFGAPVPGSYMPDLDHAGCILYWGYNPSVSRLAHATATVAAVGRGARLVVVDPRRAGLARRADHWLRVRPGSDGALALAMTHVMIDRGWFDADFVRRWTNAPLLVRADTERLLRLGDLAEPARDGDPGHLLAWDDADGRLVGYDPSTGRYGGADPTTGRYDGAAAGGAGGEQRDTDGNSKMGAGRLALSGAREVRTTDGPVRCWTAFDRVAQECARMPPSIAEDVTGIPARQIEEAARTLWESRPVAFYTWSGLEQHSNTTQTMRAIHQLYALTGSLDVEGGNVLFPSVATNPIDGADLLAPQQRAKAIGAEQRPLGPARFEFVTGEDITAAALGGEPYRVRGLVNFGANLAMAHGDSARVRDALAALDFFVHADLFMNPTAELADIILPVTSAFEAEGLNVGFEVNEEAQSLVQLRTPVAPPRGEARSDLAIIFALAPRLGLAEQFWDGDVDAGLRHQLAPSGVTLEQLRAHPEGVRVPLETRFRKFAERDGDGWRGFPTSSGRIELYSEELAAHGHPPVARFEEPGTSPVSRPDLAERFPLVLTCAKSLHFCETQHRNLSRLRSRAPHPEVELHPDTAGQRGIEAGDWVRIETPHGGVRARARFDATLDPGVVCGQHGWWQACPELDLPGYPPFRADGANLNLVLRQQPSDPMSGSSPLRASLCEIVPLEGEEAVGIEAADARPR